MYGANRSLLLLLEGLIKNDINPLIFVPDDGPLLDELSKKNISYRKVKFWAWMGEKNNLFFIKALLRFLFNLAVLPILSIYTLKFKPSIIYSNSSITPIGIYLSLIFRIPHIWHIRELGKLDYNLDYDFGKKYFYYLMRKSNKIIAISEFVKENVFKDEWKNITVISNGVFSNEDLELINAKTEHPENKTFTFLIMSLILPSKGIQDAIEAMSILKKDFDLIKLVICGSDDDKEYKKHLLDLIRSLDLTQEISFAGFIKNPLEKYKIADSVLVCSRNEAWGRVAAEAMLSEIPVIGFNNGGTKEIITDRVNGMLYNNVEELADCMKMVRTDRKTVNLLVENAKKYALKNFSIENYTANVLNTISELVD